jgi:hypothetical protein
VFIDHEEPPSGLEKPASRSEDSMLAPAKRLLWFVGS